MALVNIALYCSGGVVVVVQTNNRVKSTTKLLWVAFGLGCCCLAWLWGYDNKTAEEGKMYVGCFTMIDYVIHPLYSSHLVHCLQDHGTKVPYLDPLLAYSKTSQHVCGVKSESLWSTDVEERVFVLYDGV